MSEICLTVGLVGPVNVKDQPFIYSVTFSDMLNSHMFKKNVKFSKQKFVRSVFIYLANREISKKIVPKHIYKKKREKR